MNIRQLKYFLALSERGQISGTADLLGISQSTLSKSIASLEEEIGTRLFDRHGNYITLNEHGRSFAEHVAQSMEILENGILSARRDTYAIRGRLNISSITFSEIAAALASAYYDLNPDVSISVTQCAPDGTISSDNVDFIVCTGQMSGDFLAASKNWVGQALFRESSVFLISPKLHEFPADVTALSPADLKEYNFVGIPQSGPMFSDITYRICQPFGFTPKILLETNDFLVKIRLAGEGHAIALVPECCVERALSFYPDLRVFRIDQVDTSRTIYMLRNRKILMSEAALDFWDFVLDYYHLPADTRD